MTEASTGPLGHIYTDRDQTIVEVDDTYAEIVGRDRRDLIGHQALSFTYDRDLVVNKPLLDGLTREGPAFAITKRYVRGDGSLVWVQNHVSAVPNPAGAGHILATCRPRNRPFESEDISRNYRRARQICAAFVSARIGRTAGLFSAPAAEALLWLYRAEIEGRIVTVEQLAADAGCSPRTMLRWAMLLRERNLIEGDPERGGSTPLVPASVVRIGRVCERRLEGLLSQLVG